MDIHSQRMLTRFIVVAMYGTMLGGSWDAWWHGAIGRDTFWSPPHLLIHGGALAAIGSALYGWQKTREKIWKRLALVMMLFPLSAPFDELWHRIVGVESFSTPSIVWSPPHLALIAAGFAAFLMTLPLVRRERDIIAQRLFGGLVFAGILSLVSLFIFPLDPLGPYKVLGFWGVSIIAGFLMLTMLFSQRWIPGIGAGTLVIALFMLQHSIGFQEKDIPAISIPPHDHEPSWLTVFSFLSLAVFIDFSRGWPAWKKGLIGGFLWAGLLYGFASPFLDAQFQYPLSDAFKAIGASVIGGIAAAVVFELLSQSGRRANERLSSAPKQ